MAFNNNFLKKMISAKIWYEIYNNKLLAIVKAFKTRRHYFKSCNHEIFVLTNHNNFYHFIDTKNLSSKQVY